MNGTCGVRLDSAQDNKTASRCGGLSYLLYKAGSISTKAVEKWIVAVIDQAVSSFSRRPNSMKP